MNRDEGSNKNIAFFPKSVQDSGRNYLHSDFVPGPMDIICARGRKAYSHPGNQRYRKIIGLNLKKYSTATTKSEKSFIVSSIIRSVRESSGADFVQLKGGRWFLVEEGMVREKIGQSFRDLLHTKYRSSNKAKKRRRKETMNKPSLKEVPSKLEYLPVSIESNSDLRSPSINSGYETIMNFVGGNENDFEPIPLHEETSSYEPDSSVSESEESYKPLDVQIHDMEPIPIEYESTISALVESVSVSQELLYVMDFF